MRMDVILVLNAGSSSLKFQIFAMSPTGLERQVKGQIDGIGVHPRFRAADAAGAALIDERPEAQAIPDLPAATRVLKDWLRGLSGYSLQAVGHRVEKLIRVRFGPLLLTDLAIGAYRQLTTAEVRALKRAAVKSQSKKPQRGSVIPPKFPLPDGRGLG